MQRERMHAAAACRAGDKGNPANGWRTNGESLPLISTMNLPHLLRASALLLVTGLIGSPARADIVETKNGSRLVGSVTQIENGKIHLKTDYAGDLVIKQP